MRMRSDTQELEPHDRVFVTDDVLELDVILS